MLTVSSINFKGLQNKPAIQQNPIAKTHSQPMCDTVSFGNSLPTSYLTEQANLLTKFVGVEFDYLGKRGSGTTYLSKESFSLSKISEMVKDIRTKITDEATAIKTLSKESQLGEFIERAYNLALVKGGDSGDAHMGNPIYELATEDGGVRDKITAPLMITLRNWQHRNGEPYVSFYTPGKDMLKIITETFNNDHKLNGSFNIQHNGASYKVISDQIYTVNYGQDWKDNCILKIVKS